jgi:hypothetical protein
MSRTTDDLRLAMDRASTRVPVVADLAAGARRRARRRTVSAATVAVAASVASVMGLGALAVQGQTSPPAADGVSHSVVIPEQALMVGPAPVIDFRAATLVDSKEQVGPEGVSITFTVPDHDIGWAFWCKAPTVSSARGSVTLSINGSERGHQTGVECNYGPSVVAFADPYSSYGDVPGPGEQITLQWRPDDPSDFDPDTRWVVALYRPIPMSSYDFPPAPSSLPQLPALPLPAAETAGGSRLLAQGSNSAVEQAVYDVRVEQGLTVATAMTAPGQITVTADGSVVRVNRSWDYGLNRSTTWVSLRQLGIAPGDRVMLTVTTWRLPPGTAGWSLYDQPAP